MGRAGDSNCVPRCADAPTRDQAVIWAGIYIALACLAPVAYIAMMVKLGYITDIHIKVRQQRILPFLVSMGCTAVAWYVLRVMDAPPLTPSFALFSLIQLAIMALITLVWQISIHAVSISGAAVAIGALFGVIPALLALPLVALVGAARLKMRRHTLAQVIAGTLMGMILPAAFFLVTLN
jgi:hypothetical protein